MLEPKKGKMKLGSKFSCKVTAFKEFPWIYGPAQTVIPRTQNNDTESELWELAKAGAGEAKRASGPRDGYGEQPAHSGGSGCLPGSAPQYAPADTFAQSQASVPSKA